MKQSDIADRLGKDTAWVSRQLSGPGNWTLRTLGELCEALDGELEIIAHRIEVPAHPNGNYHAYAGYGAAPNNVQMINHTDGVVVVQRQPAPASASHILEYNR